jgi:uncharacterized protein with von Willebrand factor type A (vWA) domain
MSDTFLQNLLLFTRTLRRVGLPVAPEQSMELAQALTLVDVGDREQVFHAARSLLVTRKEHLRLFETVFNRFWRAPQDHWGQRQQMPIAPRHRRPPKPRYDIVSLMAAKAQPGDREIEVADKAETFSNMEVLHTKEFAQMTDEELTAIKRLIQEMKWQVSRRVTRRRVPDKQGNTLHLRRLLRASTKYGGIPLQLSWQSRKIKQRPIILIADISGSMEKYARLVLQFFYSVAHSLQNVESFVFGTRLTRITGQLKLKNIDIAIDDAAREVMDWAGGTRIGDSLRIFNQQWSRRVLRRGALVIIISDGWERGDVSVLRQEMRYLQHRCHRLIWLNPLSGKTSYQPRVEGMAAAMPYVDDFLPIHNLQSLSELAQHLAALGTQRAVTAVHPTSHPHPSPLPQGRRSQIPSPSQGEG